MDWTSTELRLHELSKQHGIAVGLRAVRRVLLRIGLCEEDYGREVWEWYRVLEAVVEAITRTVRGQTVSRFTLDLAAELARGVASTAATRAQRVGPSSRHEELEQIIAAVAYLADAARQTQPNKVPSYLIISLQNSVSSEELVELCQPDLENQACIESALFGEQDPPEWYSRLLKRHQQAGLRPWNLPD